MARTASGIDPYSVVTMNGMSFFSFVSHSKSDIPSARDCPHETERPVQMYLP